MSSDYMKVIARKFRLAKLNRDIWVFFIFLMVSVGFWVMQTVKEKTEVTLAYRFRIEGLPAQVVCTSDVPDGVSVTFHGKGWNAFYHKFVEDDSRELVVQYKELARREGRMTVDATALRRAALRDVPAGMSFKSVTPSKIEIFYSNGQRKRVPVIFDGHVTTSQGRYLCGIELSPDSVDIYAPAALHDAAAGIRTERVSFDELEDTIAPRMALLAPHGVKSVPDSVTARICVDIFTDKTLEVPIYTENVPAGKILRTFPTGVSVTFLVSATLYDTVSADDFLIVADYNEAVSGKKRCRLHIRQQPQDIRHLRMASESVEFVIEQMVE